MGEAHLDTAGVNNLITNGTFHERQIKLLFLILGSVFLPGISAQKTHGSMGEYGLWRKGDLITLLTILPPIIYVWIPDILI